MEQFEKKKYRDKEDKRAGTLPPCNPPSNHHYIHKFGKFEQGGGYTNCYECINCGHKIFT